MSVPKSSVDDAALPALYEELRANQFPGLERKHFDWAVSVIRERASTPPASANYWRKSLRRFFENFLAELSDFLTRRAVELYRQGLCETDLKDTLACEAAAQGLPYAGLLQQALEKADACIEAELARVRALGVGKGPTRAA